MITIVENKVLVHKLRDNIQDRIVVCKRKHS